MKWFRNLKIWKKILLSCFILILFTTVTSLVSIKLLTDSNNTFNAFYGHRFVPVRELNKMFKNILQMRINMMQEVVLFQEGDLAAMEERFDYSEKLAESNTQIWDEYAKSGLEGREKELADQLYKIEERLAVTRKDFGIALRGGNVELALEKSEEWRKGYEGLKETMDSLMQFQQDSAQELEIQVRDSANFAFVLNLSILGVSIFFGIIITVLLTRSISTPVNEGLKFSQFLADGNLTERVALDQDDELGVLGKSLNKAADDLESTMADIMTGAQNLVQAIQEISSGNENLSQRTSEQASSLEEIASTLEENTATITKNADNSIEANNLAKNAADLAQEGGVVMSEAVSSINEINESSKKIEEIISVINEISFQTNLLALNAAVEAARAGEQGRGFAVVAGEVRNLAQRSGNAAKEISDLIKDSLAKVDRGTDLSNKAGESLKEIIQAIADVSRFVSEIASASEEQKQGTEQINKAVAELDDMTQQNASLVEETASASEEMSNQAQELLVRMEQFKISDRLQQKESQKKQQRIHIGNNKGKTASGSESRNNVASRAKSEGQGNKKSGNSIESILVDEGFEQF